MKNYHITNVKNVITAVSMLVLLSMQSTSVVADRRSESTYKDDDNYRNGNRYHDSRIKHIRGVTVTGANDLKGKPVFDWGEPTGTFGFPAIFVYNEHGSEPLLIDENTPDSAILATGVSPKYLFTRGETPDVVNPEWVNVPLRDIPINVDFAYEEEVPLPGLLEAQPLELSQSEPANPITLGQWMKASGDLKIDCSGDGAKVKLYMKNLIPNRIYSAWATVELPPEIAGQPGRYSSTLPIGGTPNIFLTDENGDATFKRWIKFCPFDTQLTNSQTPSIPVLNIEVLFHADHEAYGAIPAPGIMLGLITFSHVVFPINVELLDN